MSGNLQPLDQKFAIVDARGNPTDYFTRWAQQRQIDIGDSITLTDLQTYLTAHMLREGSGIQFTPDGDLNNSPLIAADVQEILDQITATRGAILYRGLLGWAALLPGASGLFLQTLGAGADPVWAAAGGGGGGSTPTIRASNQVAFNAAAQVVTWPAGTIAGDVVLIFGGHAFAVNAPAGWAVLTNTNQGFFNGCIFAKVMTAGDIAAGSINVTMGGVFNGVLDAVTLIGTTVNRITYPVAFSTSTAGVASATIFQSAAATGNLLLGWAANRGASANTIAYDTVAGTTLQSLNSANVSCMLSDIVATVGKLGGVGCVATFPTPGTGYFFGAVSVSGP